jgi:hypothetical protein
VVDAGSLITTEFELEWRGNLWGWPATDIGITSMDGWLGYQLRGSNIDRPSRHGAYPGLKRMSERTIEVELTSFSDDPTLLAAIRQATVPDEDPVEEPLAICAGTTEPQRVMARLERRAIPTDHDWSVGHHRCVLQWVATDPKRYAIAETVSPLVGLPAPGIGGLSFPLSFPLSFGTPGIPGVVTVTNLGEVAAWPTYVVTGPVTAPIITNTTSGRVLQFASSFTLEAGQTLTIDTDARSVVLDGAARRDALQIADWAPLTVGDNVIVFNGSGTYDPAAGLTIRWRNSWV